MACNELCGKFLWLPRSCALSPVQIAPLSSPPKNPVPRSASQLINYITPLERYSASAPRSVISICVCVYVLVVVVVLGSSFS